MKKRFNRTLTIILTIAFMLCNTLTVSGTSSYKNWLQSDSRWGSKSLGTCGDTMSEIGCAVTSIAMLVVHSGCKSESSFNPGTLCDYLSKNGGFDSYGNIYWAAVTGLVSNFTFEKRASFSKNTKSAITSDIAEYINQGYYIVLSVNNDSHWVAVDTVSNGEVLIMDPAQNSTNKLFDKYNASGVLQVRLYKGKNTPSKVSSSPSTITYLTGHYKTTDALNLRSSYSTSSSVLLTIPQGKTVVVTRVYNNEWGQVEYNNKSGWIYLEYTTYTEGSYSYKIGTYKCNVTTGVYMRNGIGSDKTSVCIIPYNDQVSISSVSNNWGKASYNSKSGWVCMEYLSYVTTTVTTKVTTKVTTTTTKTTTTTTKATTTTSKPTTTVITTTVIATLPIKGDINRDGKCSKEDLVILNRYLANPHSVTMYDEYVMDVNSDSLINELDAVYLMKKIKM